MSTRTTVSLDDIPESGGRLTVNSEWRASETFDSLTKKNVKKISYYTIIAIPCLCCILFVVPMILLLIITSQLTKEFVMNQDNRFIWEAIAGNRSINHNKFLTFFTVTNNERYYKFTNINLNTTETIAFRKNSMLTKLNFQDWYVGGKLDEKYYLEDEQSKSIATGTTIKQIRPGFLRAVDLIEAKTTA